MANLDYGSPSEENEKWDDKIFLQKLTHKIKSIIIWYNNHYIGGIQVTYQFENDQIIQGNANISSEANKMKKKTILLDKDELIISLSVRITTYLEYIHLQTSKLQSIKLGNEKGKGYHTYFIPTNNHIITFYGTKKEYLSSLGIQYVPDTNQKFGFGHIHDQVRIYNDSKKLEFYNKKYKIKSIKLWHEKYVGGFQMTYASEEELKINGTKFLGTSSYDMSYQTIELDDDEHIVKVYGKYDKMIDFLCFETNKNKKIQGGGGNAEGVNKFIYEAPTDFQLAEFEIGINQYMNYLAGESIPIFL